MPGTAAVLAAICCSTFSTVGEAGVNFRGAGQLHRSDIKLDLNDELTLSDRDLAAFEDGLRHMFVSMPKNAHGNLGHRVVRHALHRFFVNRYGWWLRGFEFDVLSGNVSGIEDKDRVPDLLQEAFESLNLEKGADLHSLAALAASLERLVQREARAHLEDCYKAEDVDLNATLSRETARGITHTYFMSFILEHNWTVDDNNDLLKKNKIFEERYPLYKNASEWLNKVFSNELGAEQSIDFSKTLQVAERIGQEYHDLNDEECAELSATLQQVESKKPGRVRLSVFYNMSLHSHWKFTESIETLQNLGALDDSDPQQKYVIISNYALARPNCVNASNIYEICCNNACEKITSHIEKEINDEVATTDRIVELISNLASESVPAPRTLPPALVTRLEQVAVTHGGHVPLHGRLFKQWLHHAYPLECPYPHEAGSINPQAWTGEDSDMATDEEMRQHVEADSCAVSAEGRIECGEESSELPWSTAEELLIVGPVRPTSAPTAPDTARDTSLEIVTGLGLILCALLALLVVGVGRSSMDRRALAVPATLALAGMASCLGLLDPTVAVIGAAGGAAVNLVSQRTQARRAAKLLAAKLPTTAKSVW